MLILFLISDEYFRAILSCHSMVPLQGDSRWSPGVVDYQSEVASQSDNRITIRIFWKWVVKYFNQGTNLRLNSGLPPGCVLCIPKLLLCTPTTYCVPVKVPVLHFLKTVLTAIVAHVTNIGALTHYLQVVYNLSQTFTELSLGLNTTQSKERCCGCRDRASPLFQPLSIQPVKQVQSLRYLD